MSGTGEKTRRFSGPIEDYSVLRAQGGRPSTNLQGLLVNGGGTRRKGGERVKKGNGTPVEKDVQEESKKGFVLSRKGMRTPLKGKQAGDTVKDCPWSSRYHSVIGTTAGSVG